MTKVKTGDYVAFSRAVVQSCGYDKTAADMRGLVIELSDAVAVVDTFGTWTNEEGSSIRHIPIKNLVRVRNDGTILELM